MKKQKKVLFNNKSLKKSTELAELLHTMADKVAEEKIVFQDGGNETCIELPEEVIFQIKAKEVTSKRGIKHNVSLKLKWMGRNGGKFEIK